MATLTPQDRIFLEVIVERKLIGACAIEECMETMRNHQQHGLQGISLQEICIDLKLLTQEQVQKIHSVIKLRKGNATNETQVNHAIPWTTKNVKEPQKNPPRILETKELPQAISRMAHSFVIDKYKVISEIGRGGMGVVYKGIDQDLQREVAIKVIKKRQSDTEEKRFLREMKVAATLDHPNIVGVYSGGNFNGNLYLVMPFVKGLPLQEYLDCKKLSLRRKLKIIGQLAEALHYAHERDVIHRDIKPSNVLVDHNGIPQLTDFGLAKNIASSEALITQSGEIVGTPLYLPPERISNSQPLSAKDDIYSLGAILYEILAMRPMIEGETPLEVMYNIQHKPVVPLRKANKSVPLEIEYIWKRCVSPVSKRYNTMLELQQDIHKYLHGQLPRYNKKSLPIICAVIGIVALSIVLFFQSSQTNVQIKIEKTLATEETVVNSFDNFIAFGMYKQALNLYNEHLHSAIPIDHRVAMTKKILLHAHKLEIDEDKIKEYYAFIDEQDADIDLALMKYYLAHKKYRKVKFYAQKMRSDARVSPQQLSQMHYYEGRRHVAAQQWQKATQCFKKALADTSQIHDEATLYSFVCAVEQREGFSAEKIRLLEDHFGEDLLFLEYCGRFLVQKQQWEKANKLFSECLKLIPNSGKYHTYSAQCYTNLDNFERAFYHVKTALNKQQYDLKTLNIAAALVLKYPEHQFDILKLIHSYVELSFTNKKPQLYTSNIKQRAHFYKYYYDEYSKLSQQTFNAQMVANLLHKLSSEKKELQDSAYKGLLILRHTPRFFDEIKKLIHNYPKTTQKAVGEFLEKAKKQVTEERTNAYHYLMFKLQQNHDEQTRCELRAAQDDVAKILQDDNQDIFSRYLAARTLIQTENWEKVYDLSLQQGTMQIVSNAALHDEGFFPELPSLESYENKSHILTIFLQSILERKAVSSKFIVFLEKALEHKSLRVRILAAIGLDNWALSLDERAVHIMQKNLLHPNPSVRYLTNFYFWQSKIVQREPQRFVKVYQRLLLSVQSPEIINLLMLAPPQLYKGHIKAFSRLFWKYHDHTLGLKIALFLRSLDNSQEALTKIMKSKVGKQYTFMRVVLHIAPIVSNIRDAAQLFSQKQHKLASEKFTKVKETMAKLYKNVMQEKIPDVRASIHGLCAGFGYYGADYIKEDKECQDHILINLCYKESPSYKEPSAFSLVESFIGRNKPLTQQQKQMVFDVMFDKNRALSPAGIIAKIMLNKGGLEKQLQFVKEALKNGNLSEKQRKIYAEGIYLYVRIQIIKSLPFATTLYTLDNEDHHFIHIHQLRRIVRSRRIAEKYIKVLNQAIELSEDHRYLYYRSVIYAERNLIEESRQDLIKISKNQRYYIDLATLARKEQQPQLVNDYLKKIDSSILGQFDIIRLAELYEYTAQISKAKNVLKQFYAKKRSIQSILLLKELYSKEDEAKYISQLDNIIESSK
ncbi:serine/threonine protein kinase [Candidatus Uabimicrobium amorphum]|uniref:Protein kinase n=1 Tax=Uabimicrobium amorphum TaxID=2596890 RepID=A0A5S9IHY4_UABAM|nr:serine/threonine-protein kinase [Candidatus Uabimicrobium amorphum]BBM81984.1 protein kinase [Candidatus Uabimicrobium amorphum]